ncbi:DUF6090 family protein [Lewinella sp. W8]|uniref:DUF6090 family protein n=1 Tax=Lewinella sp. W8 TaxID=2528208 RepID=UPI001067B390|nr:DUF6090 family protein [Lewinella sp. W8]MTB49422.1 hypothetical protein [Lewinella sp. W8]
MLSKRFKVRSALASALLEILIIIVGILLSLWISNLFQRNQENRQETAYLRNIERDLQRDLVQLQTDLAQRQAQLQAANTILQALEAPDDAQINTIVENIPQLMFTVRFSSSQATFTTLESTGHLSWIRNDSIVSGLTDLYNNSYESIHHNNDDVSGFRDNFLLPLVIENFDFRSVVDPEYRPEASSVKPVGALYNHLVYETMTLQSTVNMYREVIAEVEALLTMVSTTLER